MDAFHYNGGMDNIKTVTTDEKKRDKAVRILRPILKNLTDALPSIASHLDTLAASVDGEGNLPAEAKKYGAFYDRSDRITGVKVYSKPKGGRCFRIAVYNNSTITFGLVEGGPEEADKYSTKASVLVRFFDELSQRGAATDIIDGYIYDNMHLGKMPDYDVALEFAESFKQMVFFLLGDVPNAVRAANSAA